jgi:hypothetical protein
VAVVAALPLETLPAAAVVEALLVLVVVQVV